MMTQKRIIEFQPTSSDAYKELIQSGEVDTKVREYINLLKTYEDHGLTDGEAAKLLGWPRSSVSARRNDATKMAGRHIVVNINGEKRKNPGKTSKHAMVWRLNI